MASPMKDRSFSLENNSEPTTPRGSSMRHLASSAKKKIMSFVNPEQPVWHPVSRPQNVQRLYSLSEDLEWTGDAFSIGSQIGSGSFATVFLGKHNGTDQEFAIKKVPLPSGQHFRRQKESLEREIMVLATARSPYIVSYFGSFVDPEGSNMCIVMEFLAGGTLQDVIKEYDQFGGLDEPSMHGVVTSVLKGLAYLHSRNIMHRDLKSKNILIDTDGSTKLADFGVSRELNQSGMARSMVGTPLFMAPEVLEGEAYSAVADVWSLGIVALHVANGEIPRRGTAVRELMRMVVAKPAPKLLKQDQWSSSFGSFVERCLNKNPLMRDNCAQLLRTEWVRGTAEDCEQTKTNLKARTFGRASMYTSPVKRQAISPRAGAASRRPTLPREMTAAAVPAAAAPAAAPTTPQKTPTRKATKAASAKITSPIKVSEEQIKQLEGVPTDELAKELLGWKKLALALLDERDARKKKEAAKETDQEN